MIRPLLFLLLQAAILLTLCVVAEDLQVYPVDVDSYFSTMRQMTESDFRGALSNARTPIYPYFLKGMVLFSPALELLPLVQMSLRVLGVLVFFAGLRRFGMSPWFSALCAAPLFYANAIFSHDSAPRITYVLTDAQGESLLILTIGFLLMLAAEPEKFLPWLGFTISLVALYLMRPAAQFMILLLPVLGILLRALARSRSTWPRLNLRFGITVFGCGLLPYLAWCTLRLVVVGHFGLVSFMGFQLCALAGNFLSDDLVPQLPEHLRPYVQRVLERRDKIASGEIKAVFGEWRPSFDETGNLLPGILEDDLLYTLLTDDLFAHVAIEMETELGMSVHDQVRIDRRMMEAAQAILSVRRDYHLQWIVATLTSLPGKLLWSNRVLLTLCIVWVLLFLFTHTVAVWKRLRGGVSQAHSQALFSTLPFLWELNVLGLIGGAIMLSMGLLLSIAATTAWGSRYCDAPGTLLIPGITGALLGLSWRSGQLLGFLPISPSEQFSPPAALEK